MKINPSYKKFIVFSGGGGLIIRETTVKLMTGRNILDVEGVPSSFAEDTVSLELADTSATLVQIIVKKPDRKFVDDAMNRERQASEKILTESVDVRSELRNEFLKICEGVKARRYDDSFSDFQIIIDAKKDETASIRISYFMADNRIWWSPSVQVDLDENEKNAQLTGYILINNQTNFKFEDVEMEFAEFEGAGRPVDLPNASMSDQQYEYATESLAQEAVQARAPALPALRSNMMNELQRLKKIK